MLKWLSKLPLFKDIYRQGGIDSFALAQKDVLETMADDIEKRAEQLAKEKLNNLLSAVDLSSVVTLSAQGIVFIGGVRVEENMLNNLKQEAEALLKMDIWNLLFETPKKLAEKAMFSDDGKLENQLLKGRAMLYLLDTQKTIIETFKKVIVKKK